MYPGGRGVLAEGQAARIIQGSAVFPLPSPLMDTPRRDFLQQLLAAGALTTGASVLSACASGAATMATAPSAGGASPAGAGASSTEWDMSWTRRLGKYKTAYDSPEIYSGAALAYAQASTAGYLAAIRPKKGEVTPVLILRHAASVMVLNDAMWDTLGLGVTRSLKDPTTGEPTKRNPFINYTKGDKFTMTGDGGGLDALMQSGAIVLACNNALRGSAYQLRQKQPGLTAEASMAAIRAAVLPGVFVMPNGIFAVSAAQDAGCHYMRVLA